MYVYTRMCVHMWRLEDILEEVVLAIHRVAAETRIRLSGLMANSFTQRTVSPAQIRIEKLLWRYDYLDFVEMCL